MLSVIIPTLNEAELLPKLLDSIGKQTFRDYEVIVSDTCSRDNTTKIAKEYGCKVVLCNKKGVALGRNNGAKIAKGDTLLFLDADTILPNDFLEKAISEFKKRELASSTVSLIPITNKKIDKIMYVAYNLWQKLVQYADPHASGTCILTTKNTFDKVNGFDETITFCEDHNYAKRSKKFGKFRVLNDAKIYNSVRRLETEGRHKLIIKMLFALFHRTFIGEIKHKKFIWSPGSCVMRK